MSDKTSDSMPDKEAIEAEKNKKVVGICGFRNIGNTCYMNSVLQALNSTDLFTGYIISREFKEDLKSGVTTMIADKQKQKEKKKLSSGALHAKPSVTETTIEVPTEKIRFRFKNSMTYSFYKLLTILWKANSVITPKSFKETLDILTPKFRGCDQQDAQELLIFILDMIHEETKTDVDIEFSEVNEKLQNYINTANKYIEDMKKSDNDDMKITLTTEFNKFRSLNINEDVQYKALQYWTNFLKKNHSRTADIFTSLSLTEVECCECKNKSFNFEPYNMLTLPLVSPKKTRSSDYTLHECIDSYVTPESLTGDNAYSCECCKKKTDAVKTTHFWYLPDRFIVHLKRFETMGSRVMKISSKVDFPIEGLDMGKYIAPYNTDSTLSNLYDLYAVINHSGGYGGGHYVSFAKNPINNKWFGFNDSKVSYVPPEYIDLEVVNSDAYILFYQRRGSTLDLSKTSGIYDSDEDVV